MAPMDSFAVAVYFHIQRNCQSAHPRMHSPYLWKRRIAARSFRDCILRVESRSLNGMRNDATGAAGRQCKTSKLQNCLMRGYPGYCAGEVIMRLRGANKMHSVSHYCASFSSSSVMRRASCHLNFWKRIWNIRYFSFKMSFRLDYA